MTRPGTRNTEPDTLDEWLAHLERIHPATIDMGLERVGRVRRALALDPAFTIISVGGTNGKGSACAMLEAMLHHAGYKVGRYTSPHLLRYNERVRIGCREATDEALCRAFASVEAARGEVTLTYFEFGTLAAVRLMAEERVDVALLEVGLGGRLDAVNVFDADCALVTSIALDHVEYLGDTREKVGFEKAGIFRGGRPAICADPEVPRSMREYAGEVGARFLAIHEDFGFAAGQTQWRYWGPGGVKSGLPYPALRGAYQLRNAAGCIAALDELHGRIPVAMNDIRSGLVTVENPARFQVLPGRPAVILDVAHNPHAAHALAGNLAAMGGYDRTIAVFAMLRDKDVAGVIAAVKAHVDHWLIAPIAEPRGASAEMIGQRLRDAGVTAPADRCSDLADAYRRACVMARENDRILIFGSFYTVAAVLRARERVERLAAATKT